MDLKAVVLVKVTLLVFLASSTATVDARFDPTSLITGFFGDANPYDVKSSLLACCDSCICTRARIPDCRCTDVGETCHAACRACLCTRSNPPQCRCADVNNFCYGRCNCDNNS